MLQGTTFDNPHSLQLGEINPHFGIVVSFTTRIKGVAPSSGAACWLCRGDSRDSESEGVVKEIVGVPIRDGFLRNTRILKGFKFSESLGGCNVETIQD